MNGRSACASYVAIVPRRLWVIDSQTTFLLGSDFTRIFFSAQYALVSDSILEQILNSIQIPENFCRLSSFWTSSCELDIVRVRGIYILAIITIYLWILSEKRMAVEINHVSCYIYKLLVSMEFPLYALNIFIYSDSNSCRNLNYPYIL